MSGLNQADIDILQGYVDRGERLAYWNHLDAVTLRETGQHNVYAVLAVAGAAQEQSAMTPEDWTVLGAKLITEDLKVRGDYLDGTNGQTRDPAKALNIPADQIYRTLIAALYDTAGRGESSSTS